MSQQQFFEAFEEPLQMSMDQLLMSVEQGQNTQNNWTQIFSDIHMKTELSSREKQLITKIFKRMAESEHRSELVQAFMKSVKTSMRKRPRVTRHFLELILPTQAFPRSIHKYSHWKKLAPLIDYIRYGVYGTPTGKFQQQLLRYQPPQQRKVALPKRKQVFLTEQQKQWFSKEPQSTMKSEPLVLTAQQQKMLQKYKSEQQQKTVKQLLQQRFQQATIQKRVEKINQQFFSERKNNIVNMFLIAEKAKTHEDKEILKEYIRSLLLHKFKDCEESELVNQVVEDICSGMDMNVDDFTSIYLTIRDISRSNACRLVLFGISKDLFLQIVQKHVRERSLSSSEYVPVARKILSVLEDTLDSNTTMILFKVGPQLSNIKKIFALLNWELPSVLGGTSK